MRVALVDASASVRNVRPDWVPWVESELREQARAAVESDEQLLVVAFAGEVVRWFGPGDARFFSLAPSAIEGSVRRADASDLAAALGGVEAMLGGGVEDVVATVVLGDRTFTGGDPAALIGAWREAGIGLRWIDAPPAQRVDVALVGVRAPRSIEVGAPLAVACDLVVVDGPGQQTVPIELELAIHDAAGERRVLERAMLRGGASTSPDCVICALGAASEGLTRVEVVVRLAGGHSDATPENDRAGVTTRGGDALVVGCLARASRGASGAVQGSFAGLTFVDVAAEELSARLPDLDALVTLDVDPNTLPNEVLLDFVRRGGGWLACGGSALLRAMDSAQRGALAASLPLEIDDEEPDPRDVVLLVDASGSMSGDAFAAARNAALHLVASARPRDDVSLRFFTDRLGAATELGTGGASSAERERAVRALVEARAPRGPTDVLRALDEFATARAESPRRALALVLTDGRDQEVLASRAGLDVELQRLSGLRCRLVVVAIGADADLEFLERFERPQWGSSLVRSEVEHLGGVFDRELATGRVRRGGVAVQVEAPRADSVVGAESLAGALSSAPIPDIEQCLRMRARAGDTVTLADDDGRPLLGWRREGLGLVATLATTPDAQWAPNWSRWSAGWGAIARLLARGARRGPSPPQATIDARGDLRVAGCSAQWPPRVVAVVFDAAGEVELARGTLDIDGSSPAQSFGALRSGRVAPFDGRPGTPFELELRDPAGARLAHLPLVAPRAEEFDWPRRRVAEPAGATLGPARPAGAGTSPRHPQSALVLLALAVALFGLGGALGGVSARGGRRTAPLGPSS